MSSILQSPARAILCALYALSLNVSAALLPVDLQCEGLSDPLAAPAAPELSWRLSATEGERGQIQTAWQVLVASSPELLKQDKGDLWDSGKTEAARSPQVSYAGKPLQAGQSCYWKVRSWNQDDEVSGWSEPARWEVALVDPADWQGGR